MDDLIEVIKGHHRERCFAMEMRKRQYLALGAHLRSRLGWSLALPEKERKAIAKRAADMIADGEGEFCHIVGMVTAATRPFEAWEAENLKAMSKLAEQLPVWPSFGESVRGFGSASLAVIVAEAGDLANYPTIAKLWKRMGLAPKDGQAYSTWRRKGGLTKDEWIAAGYSPSRRSRMWNIGDALIKGNREGKYRAIYLERKALEMTRVETKMHAHLRAQRYMEKRLLKDLWQAWRQTMLLMAETPMVSMSAAAHSGQSPDREMATQRVSQDLVGNASPELHSEQQATRDVPSEAKRLLPAVARETRRATIPLPKGRLRRARRSQSLGAPVA